MAGLLSALSLLADTTGGSPALENEEISELIGINNFTDVLYRQLITVSETAGFAPTTLTTNGIILYEMLGLDPDVTANQIINATASEITSFLDQLVPGLPVTVSETLGLQIAETIQQVTIVLDELGLTPLFSPEAIYNLSWSDGLRLVDRLANFFGADINDTLGLADDWASALRLNQIVSESLELIEEYTSNLILRVIVEDELDIADDQIIEAIYHGTISEEIEITAAYLSPGGGFTTWAMNTRTAAVTEYSNYEFNSFARMGNKYIGASSAGLYELNGDDDAGTGIIADIKSGFAQFAGTRHTLFKSIYLGVRGDGDFVLRLVDGEGHSYDYAVATRDMRSTKVHMGKGLRARYFSFELISDGQDFDLDTIEFVPLVAQRRV